MSELTKKLGQIQAKLNVPKGQFNSFGGYKYRSCEDILEAVKPLLLEHGLLIAISDEIVMIGERYYVKSTATISDSTDSIFVSAFAREPIARKGMDESQITGATSSYARKYALNGLLCIDDTKDPDSTNKNGNGETEKIGDKELHNIRDLLISIEAKEAPLLKYLGIENLEDMPKSDYQKALSAIEQKKKETVAK